MATVLRQQWLEEARKAGQADTYPGKRRDPRFAWYPHLEVRETPQRGQGPTRLAVGRNLSDSGIGFFCMLPFEPSTKVEVFVAGETAGVAAVVRHCTEAGEGYIVGAEFVD